MSWTEDVQMIRFELPTDRVDYLQLAFPAAGPGLIAAWSTQFTPCTVGTWEGPGKPPAWELAGPIDSHGPICVNLSPDGEWVSVFDKGAGEVRVIRVGARSPAAVLARQTGNEDVWTAVAPGGLAVAWKDGSITVVRALPGGEEVARIKSGLGIGLCFSPGGRWLTETGARVFRVFDRSNGYRVFARIPTARHMLAGIADGPSAVVTAPDRNSVAVWDLSRKSAVATFRVEGAWMSALAISADGGRVLTGNTEGEVTLWDAAGHPLHRYDWEVKAPIAAAFARDGMRAAVGGPTGRVVVWDLDD